TGALADVAGRRRSFVLGCLVRAMAYLLYTRADGFASCLVYEFIDALGTTFVSGALDAWAVDGVRAEGHRGAVDALFARASPIGRALMIAGGIVCGYLAEASLVFPWIAAAALFVACAVVGALRMDEPARVQREHRTLRGTALAGVRTVRDAPILLLLCTLSLLAAFAAFPVHMLLQPRLEELAHTRFAILGWVVAAFNVASLVGSALLPRLLGRFRREAVLAGAAIWRALMVAMLAGAGTLAPALVGLVLQEAGFRVPDPGGVGWANGRRA